MPKDPFGTMMTSTPPPPSALANRRYHGLDAIRAVMMTLGLVLHVALCYGEGPWVYKDPETTDVAGLITVSVHVFRMPIFFVMAGFFGAMVYERRGAATFARQRFDRIVVPLVIGWFVLFPLLSWAIIFAWTHTSFPPEAVGGAWNSIRETFRWMSVETNWADAGPMHLWFLLNLAIFYVVAITISPIATRLGPITRFGRRSLDALAIGRLRWLTTPLVLAAITLLMLGQEDPGLATQEGWMPIPGLLVIYGVWFWIGWVAWPRRAVVDILHGGWWWRLGLGLLLLILATVGVIADYMAAEQKEPFGTGGRLIVQFLVVSATWFGLLGLVGLCERTMRRENRIVRYFVEASYFLYLAHLPLSIFIPALLRNWDAPGLVKFTVSVIVMTGFLLVVYQLLVRNTVLAVVLNGRRARDAKAA